MGYQHYCLARILLHISEPRLRVSSLGTIENRVAADVREGIFIQT
jgi:hypothetical protein